MAAEPAAGGIAVDDSTRPAVLAALGAELGRLLAVVVAAEDGNLGAAERAVRDGVLAIGARARPDRGGPARAEGPPPSRATGRRRSRRWSAG